jgi:hypothetical protein
MLLGFREQAMGSRDRQSPTRRTAAAPQWHPAIQLLITYCQNVAGLWLKYGAKSLKYRGFFAPQK